MTEVTTPTVEAIVEAYMMLRGKRQQLKAAYEERDKKLKNRMDKLEAWLHMKMHTDGVNSFATDAGTVYKSTVNRATVSDMEAFLDYVRGNEAWHLLEKRVSKAGVQALLDEEKTIPPGVDWTTITNVNVRKPNER